MGFEVIHQPKSNAVFFSVFIRGKNVFSSTFFSVFLLLLFP